MIFGEGEYFYQSHVKIKIILLIFFLKSKKRDMIKEKRTTDENANGSFWNLHANFWDNMFCLGVWFPGSGRRPFSFLHTYLWSDLTTGEFQTLEMEALIP